MPDKDKDTDTAVAEPGTGSAYETDLEQEDSALGNFAESLSIVDDNWGMDDEDTEVDNGQDEETSTDTGESKETGEGTESPGEESGEQEDGEEEEENVSGEEEDDESDGEGEDDAEGGEEEDDPEDNSWLTETLADFRESEDEDPKETVNRVVERTKELEKTLREEDEANEELYRIFEQNPQAKRMIQRLAEDYDITEAIASELDLEEIQDLMSDENAQEKIAERKAERKLQDKEQKEKAKRSKKVADTFYESQGFSEEDIESFSGEIRDVITPVMQGEVTPEFLEIMHKGLNFEKEVEKAKQRTAKKITTNSKKNKKNKRKGDGLPTGKGGSGQSASSNRKTATLGGQDLSSLNLDNEW